MSEDTEPIPNLDTLVDVPTEPAKPSLEGEVPTVAEKKGTIISQRTAQRLFYLGIKHEAKFFWWRFSYKFGRENWNVFRKEDLPPNSHDLIYPAYTETELSAIITKLGEPKPLNSAQLAEELLFCLKVLEFPNQTLFPKDKMPNI